MSYQAKLTIELNQIPGVFASDDSDAINALQFTQMDSQLFLHSTELAADEVFWIHPDASIFYVNKSACDKLGYSREELLQMKIGQLDPFFPEENWPVFGLK